MQADLRASITFKAAQFRHLLAQYRAMLASELRMLLAYLALGSRCAGVMGSVEGWRSSRS